MTAVLVPVLLIPPTAVGTASAGDSSLPDAGELMEPQQVPSRDVLLPSWARVGNISGEREVWLLPVLEEGDTGWDSAALKEDVNRDLEWFDEVSGGRLSVSVGGVLDAVYYPRPREGENECNTMVGVFSPAIHAFLKSDVGADTKRHLVGLAKTMDCPYGGIGELGGRGWRRVGCW